MIHQHPWEGYAQQRNYALEQCGITTTWVLFIDADEVFPRPFFDWIGTSLDSELAAADAVMVPSYFFLRGKRLKYAPGYPIYHARLSRRGKVRFLSHHDGGFGENIDRAAGSFMGKYPTITISTKVNCWSGCTSISIMPIGKSGSVRTELFSTDANA